MPGVPLHPLAERFGSIAEVYDRGRPGYAPAVVGAICAELRIPPGGRVLDLAAGTGKLSRALLECGLDVVAVEPQVELRELLTAHLGPERALDGLAEAIPLADAELDGVTVADAFHWFDPIGALAEIRRVLKPGGGLALLSTMPDWSGASWAHELGTLIERSRPEHPFFDGPTYRQSLAAAGGWSRMREIEVCASQPFHPERMADYVASMSWVAAMPDDRRAEFVEEAAAIVARGETPPEMKLRAIIGLASRL
jgi:SAM-dependent methyltransferase